MNEMLPILYQDDWLVVIDKPSGLLVHRSEIDRHETRFAVQMLRDQIGRHVWPVHRLDRGTSGVLIFALDRDTLSATANAFERNAVSKQYLAVVRGWPLESGVIDHALSRQPDDMERRPDLPAPPQPALTRFERLATVEVPVAIAPYPTSRYALLRVEPETGRRHQIRRHLKHIAHPVIGDATHGKGIHNRMFAEHYACRRMLLMCEAMQLRHPHSGALLTLRASPDASFAGVISAFGWQEALTRPGSVRRPR